MTADGTQAGSRRLSPSLVDMRLWGLFAGLTLLTFGAVWLLLPGPAVVVIDPSSSELVQPTQKRAALRFAIAPVLSPERQREDYRRLAGWLGQRLDRPVRIVQRRTYGEINDLLHTSSVDFALICTGAFLLGQAHGLAITPVVVPVPLSGPNYRSLIVVRRDSELQTFEEVAAGKLALADPLSLSGHLVPLALARERGLDPTAVLSRAIHTYSHDNSIHAVEDGIVDGAAVNSLLWEYEVRHDPDVTGQLIVIERSEPLAIQPVVAPTSMDPALFEQIRQALLAVDDVPEGRGLLEPLGIGSFELPTAGMYDETEARIGRLASQLGAAR